MWLVVVGVEVASAKTQTSDTVAQSAGFSALPTQFVVGTSMFSC